MIYGNKEQMLQESRQENGGLQNERKENRRITGLHREKQQEYLYVREMRPTYCRMPAFTTGRAYYQLLFIFTYYAFIM